MKALRAAVLSCTIVCAIGRAQQTDSIGNQPPEQESDPPRTAAKNKFPLDVAGYLSFRHLNDDSLGEHRFYREYSASLFVSKTLGAWRFHSEFNANTTQEYEAEGIHLFPRRPSLNVKLDSAFVNYNARDWFQIEAGFLFVPTYWRTHRYQSTTMTVDEPLMDQNIFPTAFEGVEVHGDKYFESSGLSYYVYAGISHEQHFNNDGVDHSQAFGGKVVLHLPSRHFFNAFDVGYHRLHELYPGLRRDQGNMVELYLEKGRVTFLAEFGHSSIRPVDGSRGHYREGYYLQPWYRITHQLFAVVHYELLERDNLRAERNALGHQSLGLTYRPVPALSLTGSRWCCSTPKCPAWTGLL